MGVDVERFVNLLCAEQLICFICEGVFEDPIQCPREHLYCRECISKWIEQDAKCPVDKLPISLDQLRTAPRIFRNILGGLDIKCENHGKGCTEVTKWSKLPTHLKICEFGDFPSLGVQTDGDQNQVQELQLDNNKLRSELEKLREEVETLKKRKALDVQQPVDTKKIKAEPAEGDTKDDKKNTMAAIKEQLGECEKKVDKFKSLLAKEEATSKRLRKERDAEYDKAKVAKSSLAEYEKTISTLREQLVAQGGKPAPVVIDLDSDLDESSNKTSSPGKPAGLITFKLPPPKSKALLATPTFGAYERLIKENIISPQIATVMQTTRLDRFVTISSPEQYYSQACLIGKQLSNCIANVKSGDRVLLITSSAFLVACLAQLKPDLQIVTGHSVASVLVDHNLSKLLSSERVRVANVGVDIANWGCADMAPYDVVLIDGDSSYLPKDIRFKQMKINAKAFNLNTGKLAFHRMC